MQFKATHAAFPAALLASTLASAAFAATPGRAAEESSLRVTSGIDYSTGNYGSTQSTTITSIPVVVAWDKGPWTLKLALPWVHIEGGTNVVPGVGQVRRSAAPATASASGMGDAIAYATYNLINDPARQFGLDLTGKVKFATADENKGLGTGQNDYAVLADLYKKIDRTTLFATLGYNFMGSSPTLPLNNVWNASLGASYKLSDINTAGLSFDTRQKVTATGAPIRELLGFVTHKLDRNWRTQLYLVKGFSDGSPDWGGGATLGYTF